MHRIFGSILFFCQLHSWHNIQNYFLRRLSPVTLHTRRCASFDAYQGGTETEYTVAEPKEKQEPANEGKLLIDATCAPADIAYPTDFRLLNDAREKLESIIDTRHLPIQGRQPKPRKKARKDYLSVPSSIH